MTLKEFAKLNRQNPITYRVDFVKNYYASLGNITVHERPIYASVFGGKIVDKIDKRSREGKISYRFCVSYITTSDIPLSKKDIIKKAKQKYDDLKFINNRYLKCFEIGVFGTIIKNFQKSEAKKISPSYHCDEEGCNFWLEQTKIKTKR